jgi:hypothetical protein
MEKEQNNPDFLRILEAFRMIKDACDKLAFEPNTNQKRDLADEEINWIVQKVVTGKKGGLNPDNPFMREDIKGNKLDLEYVCGSIADFVRHCEKTKNRNQNIRVESNLDIFNYQRFVEARPWENKDMAADDEKGANPNDMMFEKIKGAEAEFRHNHREEYFKVITDILDNKDRDAFPDPTKYHWACEQIKEVGDLEWKITESESDGKQEVVFKIKLGDFTFERTIDFDRQISDQQASALDRQDVAETHADLSHANPDIDPDTLEEDADKKAMEVPIDMAVGESEQIKPKTLAQQKADEAEVVNSDFEIIKKAFKYNKSDPEHVGQFVSADENEKREIFAKILFDYRDMPDAHSALQTMLRNIDEHTK